MRMHRSNFESALRIAIESEDSRQFDEFVHEAGFGQHRGVKVCPESIFVAGLREVLEASRRGERIIIGED